MGCMPIASWLHLMPNVRSFWNHYYHENCGKGGVFVQPCGWQGTYPLWTGAISDTDYLNNAGILEMQKEYAAKFAAETNSEENPFVNVVDKGFRSIVAALKQLLLQPFFAKSDQKFNTHQVLTSAAIAADRAGNERAVDVAKRAGMLKRGVRPRESLERICDVWLGWGFQANYLCNPRRLWQLRRWKVPRSSRRGRHAVGYGRVQWGKARLVRLLELQLSTSRWMGNRTQDGNPNRRPKYWEQQTASAAKGSLLMSVTQTPTSDAAALPQRAVY
mmetsp:Transcript_7338/g.20314  ORF Transcript_7338/g.20314 Transcript_7338/m.20314 type:complete len:274 (-) Transcript_7338:192-1013(-)